MKRLIITAVGLALVGGIIIGGMVGNPFGGSASTSAAGVGGRLIELGTQTVPAQSMYVSPFAAVGDCSQLVVMVATNPETAVVIKDRLQTSPDGVVSVQTASGAVSEIFGPYGRILHPYPYVSFTADVYGSGTLELTAWLWCATGPSSYAVGGIAEAPAVAGAIGTGASGMGSGTYAVLGGAVSGGLAFAAMGIFAVKRRGVQQ